jgi:hypothetical protein
MLTKMRNPAVLAVFVVIATAELAQARQTPVGTRAAGMAGAFVAVADDATAVYWNPAGTATGSFVSAVIDYGRSEPERPSQTVGTQQDTTAFVGVSATAIALAYYRLPTYGTAAVSEASSREEVSSVHPVTTDTLGVSLVQSLTDYIVIGATPKVVWGPSGTSFDIDAGMMLAYSHLRLGVVGRNLTTPTFATATTGKAGESEAGAEIELPQEWRAGIAYGSGWTGISRVIVSVDADLKDRVTPLGDRRDVAAGVETWWLNQRFGLRGGWRRSTIGDGRAAVAAGLSAGLKPGMLLEAHVMRGQDEDRSWSIGARMVF